MPRTRVAFGAFVVGVLAFALAGPADAGGDSLLLNAKVSKHLDGPYKGQIEATIDPGDAKNLYLKVKNRTGTSQAAELTDSGDPPPYSAKFFKGSKNITDEVQGLGYEFNVAADGVKKFRMRMKRADSPAGAGTCLRPIVTDGDDDFEGPLAAIDRSIVSCLI